MPHGTVGCLLIIVVMNAEVSQFLSDSVATATAPVSLRRRWVSWGRPTIATIGPARATRMGIPGQVPLGLLGTPVARWAAQILFLSVSGFLLFLEISLFCSAEILIRQSSLRLAAVSLPSVWLFIASFRSLRLVNRATAARPSRRRLCILGRSRAVFRRSPAAMGPATGGSRERRRCKCPLRGYVLHWHEDFHTDDAV